MVQMASSSSIVSLFLLLFCCGFPSTGSQDMCNAYAPVGGSFAVPLHHRLQKSETLRWRRNKTKIFDRRPDMMVTGKLDDVYENGSLKLTNLNRGSQDPVSKPGLKVECALPIVKFTCMPAGQMPKVTVEWFQNEKLLPQETGLTVQRVAKEVTHDSFACKVSNPVSSMSSESAIQSCSSSRSSIFPKELFGLDFWTMVSILASMGGLALLLVIILIVCCVRAIQEKQKQVQEEEELRLGWTNPGGQQHQRRHPSDQHLRHHSHHREWPPDQTGPRQHRDKRRSEPHLPTGQPLAGPRRKAQGSRAADAGDQAPPLPQPRKKAPAQRM